MRLTRTGDAELALDLLVLAALAVLVIALADRITGTGEPRPPRGEPCAHLRAAADHLRPYQRRGTTAPTGSTAARKDPAAKVVHQVERRLAESRARLTGRPVPGVDPRRGTGPTR